MALLESGDEPRLIVVDRDSRAAAGHRPSVVGHIRPRSRAGVPSPAQVGTLPRPSRSAARWTYRPDGLWALRITPESLAILDDIGGAQLIDEPQNVPRLHLRLRARRRRERPGLFGALTVGCYDRLLSRRAAPMGAVRGSVHRDVGSRNPARFASVGRRTRWFR